jgi:hypothetical protein
MSCLATVIANDIAAVREATRKADLAASLTLLGTFWKGLAEHIEKEQREKRLTVWRAECEARRGARRARLAELIVQYAKVVIEAGNQALTDNGLDSYDVKVCDIVRCVSEALPSAPEFKPPAWGASWQVSQWIYDRHSGQDWDYGLYENCFIIGVINIVYGSSRVRSSDPDLMHHIVRITKK